MEIENWPFCGGKGKVSFKDYKFIGQNYSGDKKNNYKTIKQTIEYKWFSAEDSSPKDGNLNWVVLTNRENELEITVCNYNIFFNKWEILEGEEVLFWMPFNNFMPQLIF